MRFSQGLHVTKEAKVLKTQVFPKAPTRTISRSPNLEPSKEGAAIIGISGVVWSLEESYSLSFPILCKFVVNFWTGCLSSSLLKKWPKLADFEGASRPEFHLIAFNGKET